MRTARSKPTRRTKRTAAEPQSGGPRKGAKVRTPEPSPEPSEPPAGSPPPPEPPAQAAAPGPTTGPESGPTGLAHEPAFTAATITGVSTALVSLGVAYGVPVPDNAQSAIIGIVGTVAPFVAAAFTRRKVRPTG